MNTWEDYGIFDVYFQEEYRENPLVGGTDFLIYMHFRHNKKSYSLRCNVPLPHTVLQDDDAKDQVLRYLTNTFVRDLQGVLND